MASQIGTNKGMHRNLSMSFIGYLLGVVMLVVLLPFTPIILVGWVLSHFLSAQ